MRKTTCGDQTIRTNSEQVFKALTQWEQQNQQDSIMSYSFATILRQGIELDIHERHCHMAFPTEMIDATCEEMHPLDGIEVDKNGGLPIIVERFDHATLYQEIPDGPMNIWIYFYDWYGK